MGRDNNLIDPAAIGYILKNSVREPDILARLREETASHPRARFQIPPEQGQFFRLLIRMLGARRTLEVGVFTGYSSLAVALALPPDGRIIACDISEEFTSIARRYWKEAGVGGKIDLRIGPAADTLDALIQVGRERNFRFRVHRRRQDRIPALLRTMRRADPPRRPDCPRQHAVQRIGDR